MKAVSWQREQIGECLMVRPVGVLDAMTYRDVRDTMIKFAVDQQQVLIVAIDELELPVPDALTAFSSAAMRVSNWPGVPIVLATPREDQRDQLERTMVSRFVSVFTDVAAAVASAERPPRSRRAILELSRELISARRARLFVRATCHRWQLDDLRGDAEQIATELVENALLHANSAPRLRLELRGDVLTVAVSDDSPQEAVLRELVPGIDRGVGLRIVADRSLVWGCSPQLAGGKVVWACCVRGQATRSRRERAR
ncbi:MAG TPA: ATP-binding protein [Pseudonocardiaceae bacterium]|nr:ATP-binding protein [Pseudonocardiaceae bacterium]